MSHSKTESLHFYEYLCQVIGSEKVVRARRLSSICKDSTDLNRLICLITSGSKGEGLNLKGSDNDLMYIISVYAVYGSVKDVVEDFKVALVMDTEETQPCFTHLQVYTNYKALPYSTKQLIQQHRGKNLLSSDLFKLQNLNLLLPNKFTYIHGPCLTDCNGIFDLAPCLKCDQWVPQAQPWITRPRSLWPSSELITKITSCGVLFVPIGNKGSINENLQWRLSFSIAEKILIFSFSHTQLLCYALLKILLKEIVDRNEDVKGLLCSYFLKTLLFWISEETETSVWRPDNIIPCFMACLQRLIYCVEYSTLLHYFIPDNNLFYLRFNSKNKYTLINILKNSYQIGVNIFSSSETLHDYRRFPNEITRSVCEIDQLIQEIWIFLFPFCSSLNNVLYKIYILLHHCKTRLSKGIFSLSLSTGYCVKSFSMFKFVRFMRVPQISKSNNKQQYKHYKDELSQLLVGVQTDAVSGWLKLASYFYLQNNYATSIEIINYSLSKCTDDKISLRPDLLSIIKLNQKQTYKLKLMTQEKLTLVMKANVINPVIFPSASQLIPTELKPHNCLEPIMFDPIAFANFLYSRCCYNLKDLI